MDVKKIRRDFPVLQKKIDGKPIIYFDSTCMALKPKQVIEAIDDYYRNFSACGGRSIHKLGTGVTLRVNESRDKVAKFINTDDSKEIIFLRNTTEAISLVSHGLVLKKGDVVITTDKEHNSNLVPWHVLAKNKGIKHMVMRSSEDNTFNLEGFKELMNKKVKVVSMIHTSNLDGYTIPAKEIIEIAHDQGALVMLDGAQSAPHRKVDMKDLDVDFFAFSVHKMCGPTGMGVLYGKYDLLKNLEPLIAGGSTVSNTTYDEHTFLKPPDRLEAGLQDYAGIIGTGAAVDYLSSIGIDAIAKHVSNLNTLTTELLDIEGLSIVGPNDPMLRAGIFGFNIRNMDSHDIALILDENRNIMIRSGAHCVHSWFNAHKIKGSARASFYLYNTEEEIKIFAEEVKKLVETFGA